MRRTHRALLPASLLALLILPSLALLGLGEARGDEGDADLRLVEIYIPQERFMELVGDDPDGIVIDLQEYRELVRRAASAPASRTPELPPVAATVIGGDVEVEVVGDRAVLTQTLRVKVLQDGWVRCPLGAAPRGLGSVRTGDAPGWIVRSGTRIDLLLTGRGEHEVVLRSSAPVRETEGIAALAVTIVPAPTAALRVVVPGPATLVESSSEGGRSLPLQTAPQESGPTSTTFRGACGARSSLRIRWEQERRLDANPLLLTSLQRFQVLARRDDPRFLCELSIGIARRPTDALRLTIPAGLRVLGVERADGGELRGWESDGRRLTLRTLAPIEGSLQVRIDGVVESGDDRLELAPLRLEGAESDTGELHIYARAVDRVIWSESQGLVEQDPSSISSPVTFPTRSGAAPRAWSGPVSRHSFGSGPGVRASIAVEEDPLSVTLRQTYLLQEGPEQRRLHGLLEWRVESGRARELSLLLPPGWRAIDLQALDRAVGLRIEERELEERSEIRIVPERALDQSLPLDLHLVLEPTEAVTPLMDEADERGVTLPLPTPRGARLQRTDLGILLADALVLSETSMAGWRSLESDALPSLLAASALGDLRSLRSRLVSALTTSTPEPAIAFRARPLAPRGEMRAVTHLLAAERGTADGGHAIRVRCDLQVVVLDHPIDRLTLEHPVFPADAIVHILGEGIRETSPAADGGSHQIRFTRPWVGSRLIRLETELAVTPGAAIEFPGIGLGDRFGGPRTLVLQSQGSVEIAIEPGPDLARVALDDVPDFAEPWSGGRMVQAFRLRRGSAPEGRGSFTTTVHRRAPVLTQIIPRLELTTLLGADRSSRTRADLLVSSAREQTLRLDLPVDARCLAIAIDDLPIGHVRSDSAGPPPPSGFRRIAVPLPARSHLRVSVITERVSAPREPTGVRDLWIETGVRPSDAPVGETRWSIHHPSGWRAELGEGGNLALLDGGRPADRSLLLDFLAPLLQGRAPRWSIAAPSPTGSPAGSLPLTEQEARGALVDGPGPMGGLLPRSKEDPLASRGTAVRPTLAPHGPSLELVKFGGDPRVELHLSEPRALAARARASFGGALLLCLLVLRRLPSRRRGPLLLGALVVAALLPPAIGWSSPLLAIPIGEALIVALTLHLLATGCTLLPRIRRRSSLSILDTPGTIGPGLLLAALLIGSPLEAQSIEDPPRLPPPFDTVLIPYSDEGPPGTEDPSLLKAYLSHERFRELWRRAHPEEIPLVALPPSGISIVIGDARHRLLSLGDRYSLRGEAEVQVFPRPSERGAEQPRTSSWSTLLIPPHPARIERILVDGVAAGFSSTPQGTEVLIRGAGRHTVSVDWIGEVQRDRGIFTIDAPCFPAPVGRLECALPAGAELDRERSLDTLRPAPGKEDEPAPPRLLGDLGARGQFRLTWSFPRIEGELNAQISSSSIARMGITPSWLRLEREERVRATGRPVDRLRYRVRGDLEIVSVVGDGLAGWSLLPPAPGETDPRLEISLQEPRAEAVLRIDALLPLPPEGVRASLPTLTLEGAVRQESFIGLEHGERRRFDPSSLDGLPRASLAEVRGRTSLDISGVDRVHHAHGDGAEADFSIVTPPRRVRVSTSGIARITSHGVELFHELEFLEVRGAPLSLSIPLPGAAPLVRVTGPMLRRHSIETREGRRVLALELHRPPRVGEAVAWTLGAEGAGPAPSELLLPTLSLGDAIDEERTTWTVVGERGIDVTTTPVEGWEMVAADRAPARISLPPRDSVRFILRGSRAGPSGPVPLQVRPRASLLRGTVASYALLDEEWLTVHSRVIPEVRFHGRDSFSLLLPPRAELVELSIRDEQERAIAPTREDGRTEVTIRLLSPVTGTTPLDLVHRIRRPVAGVGSSELIVEPLLLLDGESGAPVETETFVGLVSPGPEREERTTVVGLTPIERERMPLLPEGLDLTTIRATWRAIRTDWSLTIREEEVTIAEGLAAVVPLLDLATRIGRDGTLRTEASITLLNERLQFLTIDLPPGARLWGVTVDGNPVAVAAEGETPSSGRIRVPVDPAAGAELAREIILTYAEPDLPLRAGAVRAELSGPTIVDSEVRVVQSLWSVRFPEGYGMVETGGRMRQAPPSARYAERLSQLVEQQESIVEATKRLDSRRERRRAAQQLARIEQQLGDSLAELSQLHGSSGEASQRQILGEDQLAAQSRQNQQMFARTADARDRIRSALAEESERAAESSPEDRAFEDRARFLQGGGWRGGRLAAPLEGGALAGSGAPTPAQLLSPVPYRSWGGLLPLSPIHSVEIASPQSIDGASGLPPLPRTARLRATSSIPPASPDEGRNTYTFRGASDPRLTLRLREEGASLRLWSGLLLLAAVAGAELLRRRGGGGVPR